MTKYRYFAEVEETDTGWLVKEIYQAEADDPVCDVFLSKGFIESTYPKETEVLK